MIERATKNVSSLPEGQIVTVPFHYKILQWSPTFLNPRSLTWALVKGKVYRKEKGSPVFISNLRPFI